MMDKRSRAIFDEDGGTDFAHVVDYEGETWRFRVNLFIQLGNWGMVARKVERWIPDFEGLYLPEAMEGLCKFHQGMILLAGVTGSGKSTTIASMLNWINANYRKHVLTIEDPIEFVYTPDKCLINQREVGLDVKDFEVRSEARGRQDPDVMLVGEMRDAETFETAMHAAETGHLVFGTIHASTAPSCIGRILDLFPQDMHRALAEQHGVQHAGIIAQKLVPTVLEDPKRVPIVEIMKFTPTVPKVDSRGRGRQVGRRDPDRQGRRDAVVQRQPVPVHRRRVHQPGHGLRGLGSSVEELKMMLKGIDVKRRRIL